MPATARPHNSTTVRSQNMSIRAARAGFRVLSPRAPDLAARWAEHLFLRARRHERPSWEAAALEIAEPGRVAYEDGFLPTWTWTPESGTEGMTARGDAHLPTVLLVHGWEGRGSQLSTFVPSLLRHGLRVVTFDAPGHGDSPLQRASVIEHARAVAAVAKTIGPIHAVIGHSVGGAAALFATRLGFAAKRFALVSPPATPATFASVFARVLDLDASVKDAMIARLEARYSVPFADIDARIDAAKLTSPLLVVHDREDSVVPFERGKLIAETAPNGELVETTGLGHRAILRAPRVVEKVAHFVSDGTECARPMSFAETLDGELFMRDKRWSCKA
jgi:pimeloyl-ACP methyl ester carboxylesterase